jgi:serine phosphatase RsbU (regulator of sigma subunit)
VYEGSVSLRLRARELRRAWRPGHALLAIPLALIIAIVTADVLSPADIHLGPLLIVAPAITASFAGPLLTGAVGLVTVAALVTVGLMRHVLATQNLESQIAAVIVISAVVTIYRYLQERRGRELAQVRTVSEAAQQVVLRPLPRRIGPLQVASLYLAAEDEAQIGGDLYAAAQTEKATRLIIGDVMGKGLTAMSDAALLLGAFREAAPRQATLAQLVSYLETSVCWNLAEPTEPERAGEFFITALVLDIPDEQHIAYMIDCGHPPPLLLSDGRSTALDPKASSPLGLGELAPPHFEADAFTFETGDILLLYTDGVIEARNTKGDFYPLTERVAAQRHDSPQALIHFLRDDLLMHAGGRLNDDAAMIAVQRTEHRESDGHWHPHLHAP